jgi:retinol dehydrogenase-13
MQGERFKKPIYAEGKVFIVTGANTGIGKETSRDLARRRATVYMCCRDLHKCEEARREIILATRNKNVYCRELDLASFSSIKNFVKRFKSEQQRLDVLINNAGVMRCPKLVTQEGFELQIGTNHLGHFLLTHLLLDYLKLSAPSRIVNVSSIAHARGEINTADFNSEKDYDPKKAYEMSKLCNVLFTQELAKKLEGTGVTANSLHPGIVDTDLMRHMGLVNSFFGKIIVYPFLWIFTKKPEAGAQTTLFVALDPALEKVTGEYFADCKRAEMASHAKDDRMADWLWKLSEKWCRIA